MCGKMEGHYMQEAGVIMLVRALITARYTATPTPQKKQYHFFWVLELIQKGGNVCVV